MITGLHVGPQEGAKVVLVGEVMVREHSTVAQVLLLKRGEHVRGKTRTKSRRR